MYRTKEERMINADVNGAANILRKSKQRLDMERLCRVFLDVPLRIRLSNSKLLKNPPLQRRKR